MTDTIDLTIVEPVDISLDEFNNLHIFTPPLTTFMPSTKTQISLFRAENGFLIATTESQDALFGLDIDAALLKTATEKIFINQLGPKGILSKREVLYNRADLIK